MDIVQTSTEPLDENCFPRLSIPIIYLVPKSNDIVIRDRWSYNETLWKKNS